MPILEIRAERSALRTFLRAVLDALLRRGRHSAGDPRPVDRGPGPAEPWPARMRRQRLADAVVQLEHLTAEREVRGNSSYGMTTENRIVWRELIDLELQEIDEQVNRIASAADRNAATPAKSNLREERRHGYDQS